MHPVLPNTSNGEGIFQNIIGEYGALLRRAEEMIIKQIAGEVEISLKDYFSGYVISHELIDGRSV
jgi:hypothetical protein